MNRLNSVDLEKLKMTGAGRAMAVLTSGGDAQGDSEVFCDCITVYYTFLCKCTNLTVRLTKICSPQICIFSTLEGAMLTRPILQCFDYRPLHTQYNRNCCIYCT